MTPEAAEQLAGTLEAVRATVRMRSERVAAVPDVVLTRIFGIDNVEICRTMAAVPRVCAHIDALSADAVKAYETERARQAEAAASAEAAALAEVQRQSHTIPVDGADAFEALADLPPPPGEAEIHAALNRIQAAMMLSTAGKLIGRAEIDAASSLFGADAVAFGLAERMIVPGWMQVGAGGRSDISVQFAASAITCLAAETYVPEWQGIDTLVAHLDPIPVSDTRARRSAAVLAQAALTFIHHPEAADVGA